MINNKIDKFQILRAIAIIMVVLIHTVSSKDYLMLRQVFNFAVPMFIFLSGYFYNEMKFKTLKHKYLLQKVFRIIIPYLFYSVIFLMVLLIANKITINDFILKIVTGGAIGPYYFIIVMLQLIAFSPLMTYLNSKSWERLYYFY